MANFKPLKDHFIFYLDKVIERHDLKGPFLDVGCGIGDVSIHLAKKKWLGTSIDSSYPAINQAKRNLASFNGIKVELKILSQVNDSFNLVVIFDVLEHIKDDKAAIKKIHSLLRLRGKTVIIVPSNPREWAWDDEFYGHYKRYKKKEIDKLLSQNGFKVLTIWDCTFPLFWLMRRIYIKLFTARNAKKEKEISTKESAVKSAWDNSISRKFSLRIPFVWRLVSVVQFALFRNFVSLGHEMIIVAEKKNLGTK